MTSKADDEEECNGWRQDEGAGLEDEVGGREEVATTNQRKSKWLVEEFYPPHSAGATDPLLDRVYPEPLYKYELVSEQQLHEVIAKMKPFKATWSGTFPNCIYKFCAALLVPRLFKIFQGTVREDVIT
ncbi:hypothetical protein DFH07DRAFT_964233 [Mycena maculata]|uniref:Uncharacterized protein n=1 Tax=Mycena maculata TaxID=230809 RepID=A0AAD7IH30_9AGAR|nr:hypothetical protein DFH07DRAFT_964233 [Mycena maculata]